VWAVEPFEPLDIRQAGGSQPGHPA
jgi:hypothetical protein